MKKAVVAVIGVFGGAFSILLYGYWHSIKHGTAYIDIKFEPATLDKKASLSKARVKFKDFDGNVLAEGVRAEFQSYINLVDPKTGGCHEIEKIAPFSKESRKRWRDCFAKQSAWIPTWIDDVRQVQVVHSNCFSTNIPIEIAARNDDWLLWWVPHPHIGGKPYTYYSATIVVKKTDCVK